MAKNREINMNLPSVDDLFTTQEERNHTIFVKQAIREQGIPFEITRETLNSETDLLRIQA